MMSQPRMVHILSLHTGDRFQWKQDGPTFKRSTGPDPDRVYVEGPEGNLKPMLSWVEFEGCFVYPIYTEEGEEHDEVS